jgi:hypothetical protein
LNEIDRIREALWEIHDALKEENLDSEDAEAMISVLDSLADLVRIEQQGGHRGDLLGYQVPGVTPWKLRGGAREG